MAIDLGSHGEIIPSSRSFVSRHRFLPIYPILSECIHLCGACLGDLIVLASIRSTCQTLGSHLLDDVYILVHSAIFALSNHVLLFWHNLDVRQFVAPLVGRFQAVHREEIDHGLRVLGGLLGRRLIDKSVSKGFCRGELVDACL